jgi:hypothetical protein
VEHPHTASGESEWSSGLTLGVMGAEREENDAAHHAIAVTVLVLAVR